VQTGGVKRRSREKKGPAIARNEYPCLMMSLLVPGVMLVLLASRPIKVLRLRAAERR
jgi:hypothetical protein